MILSPDRSQVLGPRQEYLCRRDPAAALAAGLPWGRFCTFCQALLSAWHVLRAVYGQQVLAPPDFATRLRAMVLEVVEFFQRHGADACVNEIAGFLLAVLDEDFCTSVEDDSDWFVAQWLLEGFRRMVDGEFSLLEELAAAGLPLLPGCPDLEAQAPPAPGGPSFVLAGQAGPAATAGQGGQAWQPGPAGQAPQALPPGFPAAPADAAQYLPAGKYTEQVLGPDGRPVPPGAGAAEAVEAPQACPGGSCGSGGPGCPGAWDGPGEDGVGQEGEEEGDYSDASGPSDDYWV